MGVRRALLAGAVLVVIGLAALKVIPMARQTAVPSAKAEATDVSANTWKLPRTPWGDPDMEGIWGVGYVFTPLERPKELAGKEFLTDEEVAALEKTHREQTSGDGTAGRKRGKRGSVEDVEGAYNQVFSAFGQHERIIRTKRTSLIVDPPDGRIPARTPEGQKRAEALRRVSTSEFGPAGRADDPEDRGSDRCRGTTLPFIKGVGAGFRRIVQSPQSVTIYLEDGHVGGAFRAVPVGDMTHHLASNVRQWLGDSAGRWEGDTLIVDVTNFTDKTNYEGSAENLHLTERYTRLAPDLLMMHVTVEDPTTFTRPWTMEVPLTKADGKQNQIFESACHEGNYALTSILAGARMKETAAAKKRTTQ
jgi:hypothetical protein